MSKFDNLVLPDDTSIGTATVEPLHQEKKEIGIPETIKNVFKRTNYLYTNPQFVKDKLETPSPLEDSTPEGWKAITLENVEGIPQEHWWQLSEANSPKELEIKKRRIKEQIDLDERIGRGGTIGRLAGMFISGALDPLNLIPIYGQLRFAKIGTSFIKNAIKAAPQVAFSIGLSEAALNASQETLNTKDWIWNTLTASVVGSVFTGGIKSLKDAHTLKMQTGILNSLNKDVEFKADYDRKGVFKGYKASPIRGSSVGAAVVKDYQGKVANGIDKFGENTFFKIAAHFSPNVRGLSAHFGATRQFTNAVFDSSFLTGKIKEGIIDDISAERSFITFMAEIDNVILDGKKMWAESLGYEGNTGPMRAHFEKTQTWDEISNRVCENLIDDVLEGNPVERQITSLFKKHHFDKFYEHLINRKILKPGTKPATAKGYLANMWDQNKIAADEKGFNEMQVQWLTERDKTLKFISAPLKLKKGEIRALKERKAPVKEINTAIMEYKQIKQGIQDRINNGEIEPFYTTGRPQLNAEQWEALRELSLPLEKMKQLLKELKETKKQLKKKGIATEIDNDIKKLKEEIFNFHEKLEKDFKNKEIDPDLVFMTKIGMRLVNPGAEPWLLPTLRLNTRKKVAESITSRLLQENEDQMYARIFNDYEAGGVKLKARSIMIPQNRLKDWTVRDIDRIMRVTGGYLSRRIALHDAMAIFGKEVQTGKKSILSEISEQYLDEKDYINRNMEKSPERTKILENLKEKLTTEKKLINNALKVFNGNYVDKDTVASRALKSQRDLGAATMRGAVALTQIGEIFATIMEDGVWRYIKDGLVPTLKKLVKEGKVSKEDFADANLGNNTALACVMDSVHGDGIYYQPKTGVEKTLNYAAKQSGNIFLTNQLTDFNQTVAASIVESKLYRIIDKYVSGKKLSTKDIEYLGISRFDVHEWGKRAAEQFGFFGEKVKGAYQSNFRNWKDIEVAHVFRSAINKNTRRIISQPNMLDIPFILRSNVGASMSQFMGWSFGSTANYLFPLLQRFDANKATAMILLLAGGSLVGPLRQLAAGEEVDLSAETLAKEAFFNSGVLGIYGDLLARVDASFNLINAPHRYKGKKGWELLGGPLGSMVNLTYDAVYGALHGYTEGDFNRMVRMMPWMNAFYMRRLNSKIVEWVDLPKKRKQATGILDVFSE